MAEEDLVDLEPLLHEGVERTKLGTDCLELVPHVGVKHGLQHRSLATAEEVRQSVGGKFGPQPVAEVGDAGLRVFGDCSLVGLKAMEDTFFHTKDVLLDGAGDLCCAQALGILSPEALVEGHRDGVDRRDRLAVGEQLGVDLRQPSALPSIRCGRLLGTPVDPAVRELQCRGPSA